MKQVVKDNHNIWNMEFKKTDKTPWGTDLLPLP